MCHRFVLWPFILFYVPLFCSMCLYLIQCALVLIYVPLFRSMSLYLVQCAFVLIYVPSSCSMDRHLVLCSIIPFYEPLSHSMCRPLILWTFHPTHSTPYSINSKRPRYIKVTGAFIYATSFLVVSLMSRSGCRFSSLFFLPLTKNAAVIIMVAMSPPICDVLYDNPNPRLLSYRI